MAGFNNCVLMGFLCSEPEMRTFDNGNAVCTFRMAVQRRVKAKDGTDCDFFDITTFNKSAEFCHKFFKKGMPAWVSGEVNIDKFTTKDGITKYFTKIKADFAGFCPMPKADKPVPTGNPAVDKMVEITDDQLPWEI